MIFPHVYVYMQDEENIIERPNNRIWVFIKLLIIWLLMSLIMTAGLLGLIHIIKLLDV